MLQNKLIIKAIKQIKKYEINDILILLNQLKLIKFD